VTPFVRHDSQLPFARLLRLFACELAALEDRRLARQLTCAIGRGQQDGLTCSRTGALDGGGKGATAATAAAADAVAAASASMRSRSWVRLDEIRADFGLGAKAS